MTRAGKKRFIRRAALGLVAMLVAGCNADFDISFESIGGSGDVETRTFTLASADRVEVSSGFEADIILEPGAETVVKITTDENLFEKLEVKVTNGELRVGIESGVNIHSRSAFEVEITVGSLTALELSGGSRASVEGLDGEEFDLELSGGSRADFRGELDHLELDASGGSDLDADELLVRSAEVDLSGGSSATISVSDVLEVDASGGSDVRYHGNPSLSIELSGASSAEAIN